VLIPDFRGDWNALDAVLAVRPDILNHNTETVPRLYRQVRKGAVYERSLELLRRSKAAHPEVPTKTGLMLGLGEKRKKCWRRCGTLPGKARISSRWDSIYSQLANICQLRATCIPTSLPNTKCWARHGL